MSGVVMATTLQDSEERYRMLVDSIRDHAIFMLDPQGIVLNWNAGAERIKGYRADQIIGQNFSKFFSHDEIARGRPQALLNLAAANGRYEEQSLRVRKDGSQFLSHITLSALHDTAGKLSGFSEFSHDLSERTNSDAKYRGLLEAAPDAMVVVNPAGEIVLLNAQAEKQFAYARDELVGQQVKNIIPEGFAERLIADDMRSAEEALAQHIGTGIELIGRRKDGSTFPINLMLSAPAGEAGGLVTAAIRDISVRKEAETHLANMAEALRLKHQLLHSIVEGTTDPIYVRDLDHRFILVNSAVATLFRRSVKEIGTLNMRDLLPPNIFDEVRLSDEAIARDGVTRTVEEVAEIDGVTRYFLTTKSPYRDTEGKVIGTIGIAREITERRTIEAARIAALVSDISERKLAAEHLAQMESRYRSLLEAAPDAMVVVDQHGKIVLLNLQAESRFGYRRDELLGQQVKNIIPNGFAERLIADDLRSATEALAQQIGTGIELIGRRKDGSEFPIEIMLSPVDSGEDMLVTAAIRDISVRKVAEQHLAQAEAKYRGLLEAAPDAMVVVNQRGNIVLLNVQAEKRFAYSRDELLGQPVKNIIPQGFAERVITDGSRSAAEALAQQMGTGIELTGRRKDGSEFPIEIMLSPLESTEGILITAAIRDVSRAEAHLLKMVEELNRSNEELGQFAYIASHDLQEPLRMVASYTQLLSKRYKGKLDADADEFIAFAVDGANRMQRLIQDLLAYSRVGTKGLELVEVRSESALEQAIINLGGAIDDSGAQITHDALPIVLADEMQLVQLFQNLLGNAVKYQSPGIPHIHVSAVRDSQHKWLFSVRDDGLGIDPQFFEKIFGMFQRLHKREEFAGTGIGLAICKKIVERHGGRISVESQLGRGATFRFTLIGSERQT